VELATRKASTHVRDDFRIALRQRAIGLPPGSRIMMRTPKDVVYFVGWLRRPSTVLCATG
jgi:hypothetical protein